MNTTVILPHITWASPHPSGPPTGKGPRGPKGEDGKWHFLRDRSTVMLTIAQQIAEYLNIAQTGAREIAPLTIAVATTMLLTTATWKLMMTVAMVMAATEAEMMVEDNDCIYIHSRHTKNKCMRSIGIGDDRTLRSYGAAWSSLSSLSSLSSYFGVHLWCLDSCTIYV
jgi:hypothetical protein